MSIREELAAIQLEVLALPHEKAMAAVFANLGIYATEIDKLLATQGRIEKRLAALETKVNGLADLKTNQLADDLKELVTMTDALRPVAAFVRSLGDSDY